MSRPPRAKARRKLTSIAVDPLLRDLFDLPPALPIAQKLSVPHGAASEKLGLPRGNASVNGSRQSSPYSSKDDSDTSILLGVSSIFSEKYVSLVSYTSSC